MGNLAKYLFRFVLFIAVQVYVLDQIHLHQMVTPYVYFLFILWLPFQLGRGWQLIIAFLLGFALDGFRHHPGFHAAACVLIGYIRPFLINLLIQQQQGAEMNYEEPSVKSMGGIVPYFIYAGILTLVHHSWLFLLEAWQFGNIWYFLVKTLASTAVSLLLIMITELLIVRKQKFKTNTL